MVQTIGSSAASGTISAGATTAGLEAQLARYQKQLSECVNCSSARTPEGKAEIQAIDTRISEIKDRIEKITNRPATERTRQLAVPVDASALAGANGPAPPSGTGPAGRTMIGSVIDVRA